MHGHDRVVELPQDLVRVVEDPPVEDVALRPRKDRDLPLELLVHGADPGPVHPDRVRAEPVRDDDRWRVVGDPDVLVPARDRGLDHRLDGVHAVRVVRVDVEVPADVLQLDEAGQLPRLCGLDLSILLPDLRRDPREIERAVHVLLGLAGNLLLPLEDPVLVELPPALDRHRPEVDVVVLVPREVHESRAPAPGLEDPDIRLDPGFEEHGRFRVPRQDVTRRSRSPTVSRIRRALPAIDALSIGAFFLRCSRISSAIGHATASRARD